MNKKQSIITNIAQRRKDELSYPGEMLKRALKVIVNEIYRKTAHFIYELIQNAEDNEYDSEIRMLRFTLGRGWLKVENNEKGFSITDVEAISNIGESKKTKTTLGYIGHKGIGFKAVFRVSDCPEIYSNGFNFQFDKTTDYVVPEWISTIREGIDLQKTTIFIPFRKQILGVEPPEETTREELSILDPSIFLFLKKLSLIDYQDLVTEKKWSIQKERKHGFEDWLLIKGVKKREWRLGQQILGGKGNPELPIDEDKEGVARREVLVAVPIDTEGTPSGKFPEKQIFAFLPTEIEANLRFIIQADFLVTADRENIYEDRMWNKVMRDRAADAFINGLKNWVKHKPFAQSVLRAIPHPNEISYSFFESLYDRLIKLLKETPFLKSTSGKFLKPKEIIWTKSDELRELFPNENLPELLGEEKVEYLHPDVEVEEHEELLVDLGAREFSIPMLMSFLSKKDWVIKHKDIWFHKIFKILANKRQEISDMTNLSIIPLENGELSTADEKPILPPKRKAGAKAFGLGPLSLNYVRWTLVREIPTRRTESEKQEYERNTYNRHFLRDTLGIPEDIPTDIIIDRIIPYFEEQTEGYNNPDTTFELMRYLKDRVNEISLAFKKEDAQVGRYGSLNELLLDIWRIVPFRAIRISDGSNIGPLFGYELYLDPDSNKPLMDILNSVPEAAKANIDYYVRKEKESGYRVAEEKAKQDWIDFFKTIWIHTIIRFKLTNHTVSPEILEPLGLNTSGSNHWFKNDICSEDLKTIIEKIIEEQNAELSRKLFRYLNFNFDELVCQLKEIKGEEWNFCLHTFQYYNCLPEEVLIEIERLLRKKQWVVTKTGTLGVPENLSIISKEEVEIVPDEKLIDFPRNALKPSFKEFLGLQEKADVMDVISRLKEIKSSPQNLSIRSMGELYRLLESGMVDSQEKLDDVKKEFEEGLIWLDSEWYSPNEVVWEGFDLGEWEAFPSIRRKYTYKKLFVEFLGIPEKVNFERINQGLKQLVLSGFKDTIRYTKLYYAYECLISKGTSEPKDEQLLKRRFWLATDGKFYHIDELVVADRRDLCDSFEIFSKGKKPLKILALPDAKQFDPSILKDFYDYWGFERLSGAEQIFEFSGRKPIKESYDRLLSIGKALPAKIRCDSPEDYHMAIRNNTIPNLIAIPPVGTTRLTSSCHFKGEIYRDFKPWHAAYYEGEIIVNTNLQFDPDLIARCLAITLKMPQLEDFIARVLLEPSERLDSLLEKKGIKPLSDKEVESLKSRAKIRPSAPVVISGIKKRVDEKPEKGKEIQELILPEVKGRTFGGITSYSVPSGSNQMLVDKFRGLYGDNEFLQSIERRKPDEVYFEEAEKEIVEAPTFLRIVLRRVNLDQGFLWAKRPGEQKFWGQELEEITLFGTDPSYKVTLCWNPQGDILHNKNELPLFFAKLGLVPGTVIEICTKPKLGEFVLRSIKEETIIENSKYIEFSEAGEPIWKVTPKLKFPFLVREDIYREDRRFEEWDALRELRKQDPRGAASMVFDTLKESDEPIDTGKIWNEVFQKFPYAKATIELILKNWPCFTCNEEGKWQLISQDVGEPTQGFKDLVVPEEEIEVSEVERKDEEEPPIPPPSSKERALIFSPQEIHTFINAIMKMVKEAGSISYEKIQDLFKKLVSSKRRVLGRRKVRQYEESIEIINSIIKNQNDKDMLGELKNIIDIELTDAKEQPEDLSSFPILEEIRRKIPQKILRQEIWPYVKNNIDMWVTELNLKEAKAKILCLLLIFERDSRSKEKINKKVKRINELQEILNIGDLSTRKERLEKFPIEEWAKKYLEETSRTFNSNLFNESKRYFEAGDIYKSGETIIRIDLNFERNDSKNQIIEFAMKIAKALYELYFNTESPNKYRTLKMAAQCYAFGNGHLDKKILDDFIDVYLFLSDEAWNTGDESRSLIYAKLARDLSLQHSRAAIEEAKEKINRVLEPYNRSAWKEFTKGINDKVKASKTHKVGKESQKTLDELMNKINELKKDCEFQGPWQKKVIEELLNHYTEKDK